MTLLCTAVIPDEAIATEEAKKQQHLSPTFKKEGAVCEASGGIGEAPPLSLLAVCTIDKVKVLS